ncbi:DMT family transporter [Cyanothece sp. BG0011]|uniref:DMT family transporter n=1 Tax=Cyanothece sp. BG0011 TaxID=2082950 RepID=UPI000D1EA149|nr:DMT family transporter [Cyanothece sp. BG0011]
MLSRFNQMSGRFYLLVGVMIFGVANAVTRKLTEIGAQNLIDGRNPISFCNVLFVGNLCALIALLGVYYPQLKKTAFRNLSSRNWFYLLLVALLSGALAPALFFSALEKTAVNNVILISRIEPPLALFLSVMFLRARVNGWVVGGAIVSTIGVVLTVVLQPPQGDMVQMSGFQLGIGELMAAGGAVSSAIANIISKVSLQNIALGFFNVVKTALGTVIFFVIALFLYGKEHFIDISSPLLWKWMIVYGTVIVVVGQLCWFAGLKRTSASEVSLANSFNPIAGVLAAFLILGETPTTAQYIGGFVILMGIIFNQIGIVKQNKILSEVVPTEKMSQKTNIASSVGFKGL